MVGGQGKTRKGSRIRKGLLCYSPSSVTCFVVDHWDKHVNMNPLPFAAVLDLNDKPIKPVKSIEYVSQTGKGHIVYSYSATVLTTVGDVESRTAIVRKLWLYGRLGSGSRRFRTLAERWMY